VQFAPRGFYFYYKNKIMKGLKGESSTQGHIYVVMCRHQGVLSLRAEVCEVDMVEIHIHGGFPKHKGSTLSSRVESRKQ